MGYRIGTDIKTLLDGRNPRTLGELAGDVLDTVTLVDRHSLSLYRLDTVNHDDPMGVSFKAAVFWHAENWSPWLLTAYGDCIGVELAFVKAGNTRRECHVIGREGPRLVFCATAPFILNGLKRLSGVGINSRWSVSARVKATRLATLLAECAKTDRWPTIRHKAGRATLESPQLRKIVRDQYFVDLRPGKGPKNRWSWTTLRDDPAKLPVDRLE